ncbi:MAG: nuclear transport factor 2 family protein [Dehalococcoidia bacterium]
MSTLSIEDKIEIQELYARYNHTIDFGRATEWAQTFTPGGTIETAIGNHTGTEALTAFAANLFKDYGPFRHWTNSLVVEGGGDRATGFCYLVAWNFVSGEPPVAGHHSHYEDDLEKTPEGWRFSIRRVIPD